MKSQFSLVKYTGNSIKDKEVMVSPNGSGFVHTGRHDEYYKNSSKISKIKLLQREQLNFYICRKEAKDDGLFVQ